MIWYLLPVLVMALTLALLLVLQRRADLQSLSAQLTERAEAKRAGSHQARLQYPHVDLSRCLGCGTCVAACPEDGVLGLIHGQAAVIHGARCVGHGKCAAECPTGAIQLTLADLERRTDIPVLSEHFEVLDRPGVFLAGEVTGFALIRTAIAQGTAIVDEVAQRIRVAGSAASADVLDLCIVGAGPAGLAASLRAKERGLRFCTIDQSGLGGTVAKYPRRKLVMTQPVDLPLYGTLKQSSYSKEQLIDLWQELVRKFELPLCANTQFTGVEVGSDGTYTVRTTGGEFRAQHVCLALGRGGTPRKLGVPGEDLTKVAYHLIDAQSYRCRRILVVGGGDSAVEAALGLSEQPGNTVTLSYRQPAFSRLKARNQSRIREAMQAGQLECLFESQVKEIGPESVRLEIGGAGGTTSRVLPNDDVFIMIGGVPPFELLQAAGVSFDPARRPPPPALVDQGTGLLRALFVALALSLIAWAWIHAFEGYYRLAPADRPASRFHDALRSSGPVGLATGIAAAALIVANLCYLVRRSTWGSRLPGSLQAWMTSHVGTGVLALLLILIHSAMSPRDTVGGHAFLALICLLITGAIGRYLYAFVPRAANGQELAVDEIRRLLLTEAAEWDRQALGLGESLRNDIEGAAAEVRNHGFVGRLWSLATSRGRWRTLAAQLEADWRRQGLADDQIARISGLARRAYHTSLLAAHYEDLRALLSSWRYFHRWIAWLMVLLAGTHIVAALRYARMLP